MSLDSPLLEPKPIKTLSVSSSSGSSSSSGDDDATKTKPWKIDMSGDRDSSDDDVKKPDGDDDKSKDKPAVAFTKMFRFATTYDKVLIAIGAVAAAANGVAFPMFSIIFGSLIDSFADPADIDFESIVDGLVIWFVVLGLGVMAASTCSYGCWIYSSERQTKKLREEYLGAAIRQNVGWYDKKSAAAIAARLSGDAQLFTYGTGEKVSVLIQHTTTFFTGIAIGFAYGYQMALVVLATVPILAFPMGMLASTMQNLTKKTQEIYESAGEVASDAISSIRTVTAFDGQDKESKTYNNHLMFAMKAGVHKASFGGLMLGVMTLVMFSSYGLCLWFGAWLIRHEITSPRTGEAYTGGDVITIFFVVLIGAMSIGQAAPSIPAILDARVAAHRLFEVIDRKSPIDYKSKKGKRLDNFDGSFELRHVSFRYPMRRDLPIFEDLSLTAEPGQTTAVVGVSGGGKSTIMALIERFYDCDSGSVVVGRQKVDIRDLNVRWWREQIGYVKQEPLLFRGSVKDNIRFGSPGVTDAQIVAAAKAADAHDFVMRLENGYDTEVGDRGGLLSGGQKQRVAIARAVIRNPKILLLDEATSALDSESERVVQRALDRVMKGRTTIIIAHRLSTIRNADKIVVVQEGEITEGGSHDELMSKRGAYYHLVNAQQNSQDETMDTLAPEEGDAKQAASDAIEESGRKPSGVWGEDVLFTESTKHGKKKKHSGQIYDSLPNYAQLDEDEDDEGAGERSSLLRKASIVSVDGMQVVKNASIGLGFRKSTVKVGDENSEVDTVKKDNKEKEPEEVVWDVESVSVMRVFALIKGDWWWVLAGCFFAAIVGASFPVWAIIISNMLTLFSETDTEKQKRDSGTLALIFFGVGMANFIATPMLHRCFANVGERMTRYLRHEVFKKMLRQEMGWFDHPDNSARVLTSRLETDAALVQGLVVGQMPALFQAVFTLILGVGVGFYFSWQISAVLLACTPFLIAGSVGQMKMMTGVSKQGEKAFRTADRVSGEATANIRTVAAFTCEDEMLAKYSHELEEPLRLSRKNAFLSGLTFGFGMGSTFMIYALVFWYGARLVTNGDISFNDMLTSMFALMMSAMSIGNATAMTPDVRKASVAKDNIFYILDRKSKIDPASDAGGRVAFEKTNINFNDVRFSYPSRPDQSVLNGLELETSGGQTMALVGESGAGKSTIVSLLLRFYAPSSGRITIDGHDISTLNLKSLRSQIGLVEQEPSLFNRSIRDNIRYGRLNATDSEVEEAAKAANIHDSIMEFPDAYETLCGAGGSQLSGGQKQRVAIARAILRSPKILLLDEATSALDSESEHIVQAALDKLMRDKRASRATIVIAHRLSTVKKCDQIVVMDRGLQIEKGSHDELLEKNGAYANLSRAAAMKQ